MYIDVRPYTAFANNVRWERIKNARWKPIDGEKNEEKIKIITCNNNEKPPHRPVDGKALPRRATAGAGQKPLEFCFVKARFIFRVAPPQKIIIIKKIVVGHLRKSLLLLLLLLLLLAASSRAGKKSFKTSTIIINTILFIMTYCFVVLCFSFLIVTAAEMKSLFYNGRLVRCITSLPYLLNTPSLHYNRCKNNIFNSCQSFQFVFSSN